MHRILLGTGLVFSFLLSNNLQASKDLPYQDGEFGCFSASEANRYISDFSIDVESFGGLELCNGAKDTKKLLNDIYLIEKTEFAAPRDHMFIKGFVPREQYYSWMKSQTRGVNRGHDIPFATAYNSWGYFTMQDGWAVLSTLGRVGTIIHEARHTAGYRHFRCDYGPYAPSGVSGCDTHYGQGGSHAVEMEYYARVVLESKNLHPVYKSMARLMALGRSNFVFNQKPMKQREGVLALAQDRLVLVDGREVMEKELPRVDVTARLRRTSHGASLVQGESATAVDLYNGSTLGVSLTDDYSYYKMFQIERPNAPPSLLGTEEIDIGNVRYFAALSQEGKIHSYNFPEGTWHAPSPALSGAQALVTRAPNGQAGLFVVKAEGTIVPFDLANRRFGSPLSVRWTSDVAAYVMNGSALAKLTSAGTLVDASTGAPISGVENYRFSDVVNVPLYDAFEVAR